MAAASDEQNHTFSTTNNDHYAKDEHVLGPLVFPPPSKPTSEDQRVPCMFCDKMFENTTGKNDTLLHHLLIEHQLVIADVAQVCNFKRYCEHWKERLKEESITAFCSQININSKPGDVGPQIHYYLLCDALPEDRKLREELQKQRLEAVLASQQRERSDSSFSRKCLFCRQHFEENRSWLFLHMAEEHGFNVGQPDNIVYVNEFLDLLEKTMDNLQCIYCEKKFKDRATLKEHMRKKQHKKINPKNKQYDRFYIINYLELGKTWEQLQNEVDDNESDNQANNNDDWSDWTEDPDPVVCLFCECSTDIVSDLLQHMKDSHQFSLVELKNSFGLDFYGQVKVVNFIRKRVYDMMCINCQEKFPSRQALLDHQTRLQHFNLPGDKTVWDQPQHYFSTYENDRLLCCLEDEDEENEENHSTRNKPDKPNENSNKTDVGL